MRTRQSDWPGKPRNGRILWVSAVLAALLFGSLLKQQAWTTVTSDPLVASNCLASVKRATVPWYVRSGQWRADAQSLAAILRYLSEPDQVVQSNSVAAPAGNG